MWLNDKYRQWQQARAQRFLTQHPALGMALLRQDNGLAAQAVDAYTAMQAAANGGQGPQRESLPWPAYSVLGYGGRNPLQRTLPKPTPFNLRNFSNYPPARRAINVLENPILELPFTIGLRPPIGAKAHDVQPDPTADQRQRIIAATEMFERPNNEQDGREWLEMELEDLIVLGAGVFEAQDNTSDSRPLFLWPVDAQSIRINAQWQPGDAAFRYSQGRGVFFGTLGAGDDLKFQDTDMCYMRLNPKTSTPFGLGYMEIAFETVNAFLGAFNFATRRASNETPNFGLFLGENMTPEQVARFRTYWENEVEGAGKVPLLGGGHAPTPFAFTSTGKDPLWLLWQEWIVRVIAMSFGVSPMRLGLERDVNRSTSKQGANDDWATIAPVANALKDNFTHWLLWKRLGWTDLQFEWQLKDSDQLRQAQILSLEYAMNAITVDEIRQAYERPPLPDGIGDQTRSAYEALFKPAPVAPGPESPEKDLSTPPKLDGGALTPFLEADEEELSPNELAFMRELACRCTVDGLVDAEDGD